MKTSRRHLLKAGAALTGTALPSFLRGAEAGQGRTAGGDTRTRERLERANRGAGRRILITGATVITMDPAVGNFARGDVLIEGTRISAIQADLSSAAGRALVVDASGAVVIPGFIDPHIHAWQGQLAGVIPNGNIVADDARHNYYSVMHHTFGPHYRPEDVYIGTLTPGRQADIVLLRTQDFRLNPVNNALGADLGRIRQMADESRRYLFKAAQWPLTSPAGRDGAGTGSLCSSCPSHLPCETAYAC